jgi:hypothetical protein
VLTVARPLDLKADLLGPKGEPFSRRVTSLVIQTLGELALAADRMQIRDLADISRHPGISANLCESLLLLRPAGERSTLNISISWSRAFLPDSRESNSEVKLSQEAFDVAGGPRLEIVILAGAADRPFLRLRGRASWPAASGHRLALRRGSLHPDRSGEEIRAKADLDERDYAFAGHAHLASRVVSFKGILERLPRLNRIKNVTDFQIIESDEGIRPGAEHTEQA